MLRGRVHAALERLSNTFPGNVTTGLLYEDAEAAEVFESFADEEVCPVLDPVSGTCTLYAYRPVTCRTFGPPLETEDGSLGVCELCFVGASPEQVKEAQLHLPSPEMEDELANSHGPAGSTIVAFAFGIS